MARHLARFALAALLATGCTAAEADDLPTPTMTTLCVLPRGPFAGLPTL